MKMAIKKSELYKNAIEAVVKNYDEIDNAIETLVVICDEYRIAKISEDAREKNGEE